MRTSKHITAAVLWGLPVPLRLLRAAVEPIVAKYLAQTAEKGLPGADFLKDAQALIAEARAAQP